jgi:DNA-binding NarL/FixJ family response regulator
MRILIADDHDVVRQGLRDLLQTHKGWEVCGEASNGMEALELARQLQPDLAILDLTMPLLNGLEATRRLRTALPAMEVLLFTVHESEQLASEALEAGALGYLLKSQPASELIAAIEVASRNVPSTVPRFGGHGPQVRRGSSGSKSGHGLTARQREIVQLVAEGKSNKEMAQMLGISVRTIETHRAHIMRQLGMRSVVQVVRYAVRNHIVEA